MHDLHKIKQLHHLLKTSRIFAWFQQVERVRFCHSNTQAHLQFFCKSKLQPRQKDRAATQMDHSSTTSKISFHGPPSKSRQRSIRKQIAALLSLIHQLIVLLFLQNSHLQRDMLQTFFCHHFCEILVYFYSAQGSTITVKLLHVNTYVCQSFAVCDICGQIPKSKHQTSHLLPSDFPNNLS